MAEPQGYELDVLVVTRRRVPVWHPPALLLTTLAALAAMPVGGQSTALPVVKPRPAITWVQARALGAVEIQPHRHFQWANPSRRRALVPSVTSGGVNRPLLSAAGGGVSPGLPVWQPGVWAAIWAPGVWADEVSDPPFRPLAWANPARRKAFLPRLDPVRSRALLDAPVPLRPTAWSNPPLVKRAGQGFIAPGLALVDEPVQEQGPLNAVTLSLPRRALGWKYPAALLTWTQNRPQFYQDIKPNLNIQWPVPGRKAPHTLTWVQNRPSFYTEPAPPLLPIECPVPKRKAPQTLTWTQNRPSYYAEPAPPPSPFVPGDWPIPDRKAPQTHTWIQTRPIFAVDIPAFVQTSWPIPVRRLPRLHEGYTLSHLQGPATPPIVIFNPVTEITATYGTTTDIIATL